MLLKRESERVSSAVGKARAVVLMPRRAVRRVVSCMMAVAEVYDMMVADFQ